MPVVMRFDGIVNNPFAGIFAQTLLNELRQVQLNWARRLQAKVVVYPAERPNQQYIRTFEFRDNWDIVPPVIQSGDMITELNNDTSYGRYVVGDDVGDWQNQAYHAGRWYLLRKEVEASEPQLRADAQAAINRVLAPARITP